MSTAAKKRKTDLTVKSEPENGLLEMQWPWILAILLGTALALRPSLENGFTNWDDHEYLVNNPLVHSLDKQSLTKMFTTYVMGNYHPLTLVSLAIDYQLFALQAKGYHFTNLVIHLINTLLVFFWIQLLTGKVSYAGFVALLCGLHPMRVESVAWISARKDLLCALFYLSSLIFYFFYVHRRQNRAVYYLLAFVAFLSTLLSKAMAITLVPVIFLMDYCFDRPRNKLSLLEKIPFLGCALLFGLIALNAQREARAITDSQTLPFADRSILALYALDIYIFKAFLPLNLSAFHRYPQKIDGLYPFSVYTSSVLLLAMGLVLYRVLKPGKTVWFGLLFFLLNLLPVLQWLPVGSAIVAERYSYLSYLGLFLAVIAILHAWASRLHLFRLHQAFVVAAFLVMIGLGAKTYQRCEVWRNSGTLWTDALRQYPEGHPIIFYNLASYYLTEGNNLSKALDYVNRGLTSELRSQPEIESQFYILRGRIFSQTDAWDQAWADFSRAIELNPRRGDVYISRSFIYFKRGEYARALQDLKQGRAFGADVVETYEQQLEQLVK